jgi:superfamily I DNA/RNA helicase
VAVRAAELVGPDNLCAITFTRAGADELAAHRRCAEHPLPGDAWQRKRVLDARLPWVGTIHSLAYSSSVARPRSRPATWRASSRPAAGTPSAGLQDVDDQDSYAWAEPGRDEVEAALAALAGARHRRVSVSVAL